MHHSIPVRFVLVERGMNLSAVLSAMELQNQLFKHSETALLPNRSGMANPFPWNLIDWLHLNCRNTKTHIGSYIPWGVVFPIGI